ncbi:hypothetical protein GR183_12685 [Stappia sp. GBMRC 2046]|uniref:Uncharacterized protein n=1 Tax=Stappia sediminis TaxID=2692190 RepID=A0A7X3LVB0_9HYPH|nr:hypothetical protein [Stappia sediminis]MXN65764.1 hypothetical protein [Stappia sediminis]
MKTTAFAGYQYVNENYVADGLRCNPVQQGVSKCSPYPDSRKAYDIDANWHLFRLGLGVDADIGNGFYFQGEAVAIPAGYYDAEATIIYQAPALGPAPNVVSDGTGAYGFQAEGILTYDVTENFTIGAGGRYWWFNSGEVPTTYAASTVFPLLKSSKTEVTSERYGLIAEAKYRF